MISGEMTDPAASPEKNGRVQAVAKAAAVLNCFAPRTPVLSIREITRATGIPRSTVHALCVTLVDARLLEEVPRRGYQLGLGLVPLGGQVLARQSFVEATEGLLGALTRENGIWVLVGQLVDGWIVHLARYVSERHGPVNSRAGLRAPAHRTAGGKAALSLLDDAEVMRRVRLACAAERLPLPDEAALLGQLDDGRRSGYVVSADWRPGRLAIGAPVGAADAVVGGISVVGPSSLFTPQVTGRLAARLVSVAARVGERLSASR
jgi:DNA-binding IclR family transcriptional regulator